MQECVRNTGRVIQFEAFIYYNIANMKTYSLFVSTALVFGLTACDHKAEEPKSSVSPGLADQVSSAPVAATAKVEAPNKVQAVSATVAPSVVPVKDVNKVAGGVKDDGKKSTGNNIKPADATDQTLADTIDHAREVTKSQESKSRQHSQKAEDEMAEMLKK